MSASIVTDIHGPARGEVSRGDHVEVQLGFNEAPIEGQVVAESEDGTVTVVELNSAAQMEVERSQIVRSGHSIEEIEG